MPGLQIQARFANDPTNQGRFLLRLPNDWNGKLVVAGASGTRSEFNGDFAWSDYVIQKGYAYASQNKGVLNLQFSARTTDPLACRLNPTSSLWVRFYDNEAGQPFTRWQEFMVRAAKVARVGVKAHYGHWPRYTYAVGTSNGGYQVRRAVETAPELFDGGVDWEGTYVDERDPNLLNDLAKGRPELARLSGVRILRDEYRRQEHRLGRLSAGHRDPSARLTFLLAEPFELVLGSDAVPVAEAARPDVRHLWPTIGTATYNYYARLSESDVGSKHGRLCDDRTRSSAR